MGIPLHGEEGVGTLLSRDLSEGQSAPCILIVDDEAAILAGLGMFLEDEGYQVLSAMGATAALTLVRQEQPVLVISDYMMPGMNGGDLLRTIRSQMQAEQRTTPILVLMSATHQIFTRSVVVDAVIPKPFDLDEIAALLTRLLPGGGE